MPEKEEGERSVSMRPVVLPETLQENKILTTGSVILKVLQQWNDGEKLLWLRVRLTGKANVVFNQLMPEAQQSYAIAKQALQELVNRQTIVE